MPAYRSKRIQVLRRLARQRDRAEPLLSGDLNKDIIDEYFDKGIYLYVCIILHECESLLSGDLKKNYRLSFR